MKIKRPCIWGMTVFVLGQGFAWSIDKWKLYEKNVDTITINEYQMQAIGLCMILCMIASVYAWDRYYQRRDKSKKAKGGACLFLYSKRSFGLFWVGIGAVLFVLGMARVDFVREKEQASEAILTQYSDTSEKLAFDAVLYAEIEDMEVRKKNEQMILVVQNCYLESDKVLSPQKTFLPQKGRITLEWEEGEELPAVGDQVTITGQFFAVEPARNPGEWDSRSYYYARKIGFSGLGETLVVQSSKGGIAKWLYQLRERASTVFDECLEERDAGILKAVILGEKQELDSEEKELYQVNGIAHLLAISGLHISLLGMACWKSLRKLFGSLWLSGVLAGSVVIGYGCFVGMGPSVVRAILMFCVMLGANMLGRTYDIWSAWAMAMCFLLWDSPRLLFDAGFQLSFGAIASIVGIGTYLSKWILDGKQGKEQGFLASLAVQWGTLPLICYWYFEIPLYAVFLNLLVIPCMAVVFLSGMAMLGFGVIGNSHILAVMTAGPAHAVLTWYHVLCSWFQKLPMSRLLTGRPNMWKIVLYYAVMAVFLWVIIKKTNNKEERKIKKTNDKEVYNKRKIAIGKESDGSRLTIYKKIGVLVTVIGCSVCILLPSRVSGLEVWFLDVGQGDGILLRTREHNVLIDGGSSDRKKLGMYVLEPCLKSLGISKLDVMLITHGDQDHMNGAEYLLSECEELHVANLLLPKGQSDSSYDKLKEMGAEQVWEFGAGDIWTAGEFRCVGLAPFEKMPSENKNNHSIVLLAQYQDWKLLLTGDVEKEGEEQIVKSYGSFLKNQKIQVLKVAHHGAKTSTTQAFLECINPEYAIVSYGRDNSYGHPAEETIKRLNAYGVKIVSTAKHGAICMQFSDKQMKGYGILSRIKLHGV